MRNYFLEVSFVFKAHVIVEAEDNEEARAIISKGLVIDKPKITSKDSAIIDMLELKKVLQSASKLRITKTGNLPDFYEETRYSD